ncbi:MAG: hypothetical protein V1816_15170 [Pseudomonadota bacterium]
MNKKGWSVLGLSIMGLGGILSLYEGFVYLKSDADLDFSIKSISWLVVGLLLLLSGWIVHEIGKTPRD